MREVSTQEWSDLIKRAQENQQMIIALFSAAW